MLPQSQYCQRCGNQHGDQDCAVNPVMIEWKYGGETVQLYGSWSQFQWGHMMTRSLCAPFFPTVTINIPEGTFEYKFKVDGVWRYDHNELTVSDNFGSFNNQIVNLPRKFFQVDSDEQEVAIDSDVVFRQNAPDTVRVRIKTNLDNYEVFVKGSWDDWTECILLKRKFQPFAQQYQNYGYFYLQPGSYQYKFIIQNQWLFDERLPTTNNQFNSKNNILHVKRTTPNYRQVNYDKVYFTKFQIVNYKSERVNGMQMTCIGDEFYIFGGYGSNFTNNFYQINSTSHHLNYINDTKGPIPDPRAYHNQIRYANKIIIYGGLNSSKVFDDYYVYNTTNQEWKQSFPKGDIPPPREKATLTILPTEQTLIYFGGYFCSNDMEFEQVYNDVHCLSLSDMVWKEFKYDGPIPPARYAHTATQIGSKMYVFGGAGISHGHYCHNYNDLWVLDFNAKQTWQNLTAMTKGESPSPRHGHSAVLLQRHIFVFGGKGENPRDFFGDLYHLDPNKLIWSKPEIMGTAPIPRCYHATDCYRNNELWLIGGNVGFKAKQQSHLYIMSFEEKEDFDDDETRFTESILGSHLPQFQEEVFLDLIQKQKSS